MERTFSIRGRALPFEELVDVGAVVLSRSGATADGKRHLRASRLLSFAGDASLEGVPLDDAEAFLRAGVLIATNASLRRMPQVGPGPIARRRVYIDPLGRTMVESGRLIALHRDQSPERSMLARAGVVKSRPLTFHPGLFLHSVGNANDVLDALDTIRRSSHVELVEPEFLERLPVRSNPSDPDYRRQWHLRNDGINGRRRGADVDAERAWDLSSGSGTRVAVVDYGFGTRHPDLDGCWHQNSGWFDDDGTFNRGLHGMKDVGHGTGCAGMALARANNTYFGCGLAYDASLIAIACLEDALGSQTTLADAIAYAADPTRLLPDADPSEGAHAISCSIGPNGGGWRMNLALELAIRFAARQGRGGRGTPIFWGCSNANEAIALDQVCSHPDVAAVAGTDSADNHRTTAYGPELRFVCPAENVHTLRSGNSFGVTSGNSYAAPLAAAVAALMYEINPELSSAQLLSLMEDSCDKVGSIPYSNGRNDRYGCGRINAYLAAQAALRTI